MKMTEAVKSKYGFIKIKCHECGNEQIMFGKASTKVECLNAKCKAVLAVPTGGKAAVKAEILELI
ncbi:MAG: 30S ribosomal protein S27e [Nanoarchaeota archaeon]|nr:30S ribosomal protein S27e [Nanoarchaeota archaeon]